MRVITSKKKVVTSADVQFSDQNQVKTEKKKVFTPSDVQFSSQNPDCTFCDMVWEPHIARRTPLFGVCGEC